VTNAIDDELTILRTLASYCQRCDDGDFPALVDLFAPDGTFTYRGHSPSGRAALERWFAEHYPPNRRGKHLTMDSVIDITGDRATAVSDFMLLGVTDGAISVEAAGRYRDAFVRSGDRWLIERRDVELMQGLP
jgi:ketosteroid isomerase-like protein